MCMVVRGEVVVRKAEEDVVCYKVLRLGLESPYRGFVYTLGETNETEMDTSGHLDPREEVEARNFFDGFHTFVNEADAIREAQTWSVVTMYVYRCVIPKGSRYIEGTYESFEIGAPNYLSDSLRVESLVGVYHGLRAVLTQTA